MLFIMHKIFRLVTSLLVLNLLMLSTHAADDLFEQEVAPLLQKNCLNCHNSEDKKSGLSLETREAALAGGDLGASVVPHDAEASYLLELITPHEGKADMPKGAKPLSAAEIEVLRKWIAAGAPWPAEFVLKQSAWWSKQVLVRPEVPTVPSEWEPRVRTPIDAFILSRLHEHGMSMSPEADARTLIRRVYYDLTGLPPTPEQIAAFAASTDPLAYERVVDELLESPHYGERWARHWFDVVTYADTCGYDKDKLRPNAWPYRDYVIRSFNTDKPYSRFVQEQVAGDILFPGESDGILGLGFLAAGPWDFIGHVEVSEAKIDGKVARNLDRDEMVSNTLNTFCSVTIQCARCHDHKFDPYTQQHYYGLQSVFAAIDRAERPYDADPAVTQQRIELAAAEDKLNEQLAAHKAELAKAGGAEQAKLEAEIKRLTALATPAGKRPEYGYHSGISPAADAAKWVMVDLGAEVDLTHIVLHACHDEFGGIGAGFGFPVRFKVEASSTASFEQATLVSDQTGSDFANPGLVPFTIEQPIKARFLRVTATQLALRQNDYIFALSELEAYDTEGTNVAMAATVTSLDSIEAPVRWARKNLVDGIWPHGADPQAVEQLAASQAALTTLMEKVNTPQQRAQQASLEKQLAAAKAELAKLPEAPMVYAGATHFAGQGNFQPTNGKPRPIHVLRRGNVTDPAEVAVAGAIPLPNRPQAAFELPPEHSEADRRAALAQWLTDRDNPLTWRSIVNRMWLYHFGQAIVQSPNDFGRMGQLPTHPQLLDWLAVEFRDGGESMKKLHRLIVLSSVYRQASSHVEEYATRDGGNQFLWRQNRRRLEAEEIRDSILKVSGRLNPKMGGPGYYLFELEKTAHSPHYEYEKFDPNDARSHRRSIYRFIARSQPDPYMTTLDCADSSQSTPRRDETLTSLQALSMLNNNFNLAMAEHFAQRLTAEREGLGPQVARAIEITLGRPAEPAEQQAFEAYAAEHGLSNLCLVMFNLSEFVYLD